MSTGMVIIRRIAGGVVGIVLVITAAACRPALANQAPSTVSATPAPQFASQVVWGRIPYCNCFGASATATVADALEKANLAVSLKEQSPRDGWLYFVATYDPHSATEDEVSAALVAGGAEVLDGPP